LDFLASQQNGGKGIKNAGATSNLLPNAFNPALFAQYSQNSDQTALDHLASIGQGIQQARQYADEQAAAAAAKKREAALMRQIRSLTGGGYGGGGKGGLGGGGLSSFPKLNSGGSGKGGGGGVHLPNVAQPTVAPPGHYNYNQLVPNLTAPSDPKPKLPWPFS
jgi:hypothetical protein